MKNILLFADKLPPNFGGMEIHAQYFIAHYKEHKRYSLSTIITKNLKGEDYVISDEINSEVLLLEYLKNITPKPHIIFFNSGYWIEELANIRTIFPYSLMVYRTGGNEIIKAPLMKNHIYSHKKRQGYWANQLNSNIDILITNSQFTENRLTQLGINTKLYQRCIGGVDFEYLKKQVSHLNTSEKRVFLCASRFVPYKNHRLLIEVFRQLKERGYDFILKLAGDGSLLSDIKNQVKSFGLENQVQFVGGLSNKSVLNELLQADYYIQFSSEYEVEIEGGKYIHAEGMGRSILEAISCGTFVICTNTGAISEIINEENGLLFDINRIDNIICQIEELLLRPKKIKSITNQYSWDNYFKLYDKLFNQSYETISDSN